MRLLTVASLRPRHLSLGALSLPDGWIWVPAENWFVDRVGKWAEGEVDHGSYMFRCLSLLFILVDLTCGRCTNRRVGVCVD